MKKINENSVEKVRDYFGVAHGFDVMIMWGTKIECAKSNTSKGRYEAMSTAFTIARGMIGQKVKLTTKKLTTKKLTTKKLTTKKTYQSKYLNNMRFIKGVL